MNRGPRAGEIYIEFRQMGKQVQVTAIDAATGVEVSMFGPSSALQSDLQKLAVRKLKRRVEQVRAAELANKDQDPTLY
ncbi:hypothetical protein SADFL11_4813 [Roseibium alexandrii DFL-11]|uniref:DUF6898 domain-containing protein n=2 Tax=Roseibium alexandrii TaxID=388408 RepID=A0A5E8H4T6_ROSAD|nr:hypothetical protein SADFL11_4813 [Roseibium alexandrii DFL-11]